MLGSVSRVARTATALVVVALACGLLVAPAQATQSTRAAQEYAPRKHAVPGSYVGRFETSAGKKLEGFSLRVSPNGRRVTQVRAALDVTCSYFPPEVETHALGFPRTAIKRNGTFKRVWRPHEDATIALRGTFRGRRLVSGYLDYTVGVCVRTAYLEARRVR